MNRNKSKRAEEPLTDQFEKAEMDPVLKQALGDFRASVDAWSAAEFARPRAVPAAAHGLRRVALGWSLAGLLVVGGVSGVVMVAHDGQHRHAAAAAHEARSTPQPAQQQTSAANQTANEAARHAAAPARATQATEDEELLASVDSAVSRTVPSAMEPLVDMGTESGTSK